MLSPTPERVDRRVDPARLAALGGTVSGVVALSGMGRLASLLEDGAGEARYELHFRLDGLGRCRISGRVSTRLTVRCQRCLQPMELAVDCAVDAVAVEGEEGDLAAGLEPLELEDGVLDVARAVEDELLLGLSAAPTHPPGGCDAPRRVEGADPAGEAGRRKPFATLATLLDHHRHE